MAIFRNKFIEFLILILFSSFYASAQYSINNCLITENKGQIPKLSNNEDILFYTHLKDVSIYFSKSSISFVLYEMEKNWDKTNNKYPQNDVILNIETISIPLNQSSLAKIETSGISNHHLNFYYPHCPEGITDVNQYTSITYKNIFSDIDLTFHIEQPNTLKFNVTLHDNADIKALNSFLFATMNQIHNCKLILNPESCEFSIKSYQTKPLHSKNDNTLQNKILSPEVRWSTYFGGEDGDHATGIVYDYERKIVVTGYTLSKYFPATANAEQKNRAGFYDGFIAKFDDNGNLIWATYFGGEETDYTEGICLDNFNNIYIAGYTWSRLLPVTPGAHQVFFAGGQNDAFIASFDKFGKRRWATYYGGSSEEHVYDIASNLKNEIAIVGRTRSGNLYISDFANRRNPSMNDDAFIVRFNLDGSFKWGTYWGGDGDDVARAVIYDKLGNFIVTGFTNSPNFPLADIQVGDITLPQSHVIFISKFDVSADFHYPFSRLYGGSRRDEAWAITLDKNENIYLTGFTLSSDFPMIQNQLQSSYSGADDAFIMKLNNKGRIIWSSYIGGLKEEIGTALAIDQYDNIIIAGRTNSENIQIGNNFPDTKINGNYDIFLVKLDPNGKQVLMFDYLGGSSHEWVWGIAHETIGASFYICGATESNDFPLYGNIWQNKNNGLADAIIAKLCSSDPKPTIQIIGKTRFCEGDSVILRASDGFTHYFWSTGARTQQITVKRTGDYYVEVVDSLGCIGKSATVFVIVISPEPPEIIGSLGFCPNDSTYIEVKGEYVEYLWSTGQKSKGIYINKAGNYSVTVLDTNGCRSSASFKVSQFQSPTPHILGPKTVCAFSNDIIYRLNANPWECYIWKVEGGIMEYGVDSINISVDWGEGGMGKVIVIATNKNNGCIGYDTMQVKISDKLEPKITSNTGKFEFCEGDSIIINAGSEYHSYIWSNGESKPEITVKTPGKYWLVVKDTYECTGTDTVDIVMHPLPESIINGEFDVCEFSKNIKYESPLLPFHSYIWTVEGGEIISSESENIIFVNWKESGIGYIKLTISNESTGCSSISEPFPINIHPLPKAKIIANKTEFCEGDSIQIELDQPFKEIKWNNGANTQQISIKSPGKYFATVFNKYNCSALSDTIEIIMHPNPPKPTIERDIDILYVNTNDICQWYFNDNPIIGATTNQLKANQSGYYKVKVTNKYGCFQYSDNYPFDRGYAKISIIPDTIFANTGEKINISIIITESLNLKKAKADKFSGSLIFNSTILYPTDKQQVTIIDETISKIQFFGNIKDTFGIISQLEFIVALGEVPCTELQLDSIIWHNSPVESDLKSGYLCIADLCYANDKVRLLSFRQNFALLQNTPNPFSNKTEIKFQTIESGKTRIDLFDLLGRKIKTIFENYIDAGEYSIIFAPDDLSPGLYYYTLITPTMFAVQKMQILE